MRAKITQAQETKGLSLSPITLKVLIVPLKPSLYVLILLNVLPRYVLKQINNTIKVSIDWKLNKALYYINFEKIHFKYFLTIFFVDIK